MSRGPWIGVAVSQIILFWKKKVQILFILLLFGVIFIQPYLFTKETMASRDLIINIMSDNRIGSGVSTPQARYSLLQIGLEAFKDRPFLGYGLRCGQLAIGGQSIENYFLLLLLESGFLALLLFLVILVITFMNLIRLISNENVKKETKYLSLGILAALSGYALILLLVTMQTSYFIFWILLGLSMRLIINERMQKQANVFRTL